MKIRNRLLALTLLSGFLACAHAQTPIRMIIPAPAGGGTDGFFRAVAKEAEPLLKTSIVVMNVGGAGGTIGVGQVIRSAPDGTTIAAVWNSPITAAPHALKQSYRPDDLTPIIQISSAPYVMCVAKDFPATTGPEFIELLRKNPGKYTYGNDGVGGIGQLASERIFRATGVSVRDVPFKGAGETLTNFLGGHVDIYMGSILPIQPHLKSGKAKCVLVTSAERAAALPETSGLKDIGIPGEETLLWRAILGPKGLPADKLNALESAFEAAAKTPGARKFIEDAGEQVLIRKGADLRDMINKEYDALGRIAATLNIQRQ